ncbi:MAG: DUF5996 family protein [Rhodanobacteraceae bacterium]
MSKTNDTAGDTSPWGDLRVAGWAGTKRSLHLYAQMLGKIRVALSPTQPNWMFTALYLFSRGLTTGPIPWADASIEASIDVISSDIAVSSSKGAMRKISLLPARTVAEIYAELSSALGELDVACFISPEPQEIPDTTPLHEDRRDAEYDPAAVVRWFNAATATAGIFASWVARFHGRSGIQVWWGAFDVALILFSGKRSTPPIDRGFLMKYDLDAELMNVGLYLGDETTAPFFYAYIYPQPKGAESLPIAPSAASWSAKLQEWVLPYDDVRAAERPDDAVRAFLDSVYEQCFAAAGWNRDALSYDAPRRISQTHATPDR